MKKCNCGKDMEDWMSVCKDCYSQKPEAKDRQESIERQTACKCVAQAMTGTQALTMTECDRLFEWFLEKIRGK